MSTSLQNITRRGIQKFSAADMVTMYNTVRTEEQRKTLTGLLRNKLYELEHAPWIFQLVLDPEWNSYDGRWYWGWNSRYPQIDPRYKISTEDYEIRGNPRQLVTYTVTNADSDRGFKRSADSGGLKRSADSGGFKRSADEWQDVLNFMLQMEQSGGKPLLGVQHWPRQIVAVKDGSSGQKKQLQPGTVTYWYPIQIVFDSSELYWEMLMNLEKSST